VTRGGGAIRGYRWYDFPQGEGHALEEYPLVNTVTKYAVGGLRLVPVDPLSPNHETLCNQAKFITLLCNPDGVFGSSGIRIINYEATNIRPLKRTRFVAVPCSSQQRCSILQLQGQACPSYLWPELIMLGPMNSLQYSACPPAMFILIHT